jgi:hemerythrin superfamily protein
LVPDAARRINHAMADEPIWDVLKRDHDAVAAIIDAMCSADEAGARALLTRLDCELTAHTRAEEAVFHGRLIHQERAQPLVLDGLEDHRRIHATIAELELLPAGDDKWAARISALGEAVRNHFKAEEEALFPLAREVMSDIQASDVAARYLSERARIAADLSCLAAPS